MIRAGTKQEEHTENRSSLHNVATLVRNLARNADRNARLENNDCKAAPRKQ